MQFLKIIGILLLGLVFSQSAYAQSAQPLASIVRAVLAAPEADLSYEHAKLAFDSVIDPDVNREGVKAQIDAFANDAERIAGGGDDIAKLKAVRQVIYEAGSWNGGRPFSYDHSDPFGQDLRNKLLAKYLDTRKGNCVSMPILQLIVAERLGLNVSLSTAPEHVFLRYTNPITGRSIAIESTNGGHPARESDYYGKLGVTDVQVKNGIYLGLLTKRESIAVMASTVTEWLMQLGRYDEAIAVSDVLLEHYPKYVHALLTRGTAYAHLMRVEFIERYPGPSAIPLNLRSRFVALGEQNAVAFQQAEEWGWKLPQALE